MLTKEYIFVLRNLQILLNFKKKFLNFTALPWRYCTQKNQGQNQNSGQGPLNHSKNRQGNPLITEPSPTNSNTLQNS